MAADAATAAHRDAVRRIALLLDMKAAAVAAEDFALADKYKQQVSTLRAYQRQAAAAPAQQQLQALAARKEDAVLREDYAAAAALKVEMDALRSSTFADGAVAAAAAAAAAPLSPRVDPHSNSSGRHVSASLTRRAIGKVGASPVSPRFFAGRNYPDGSYAGLGGGGSWGRVSVHVDGGGGDYGIDPYSLATQAMRDRSHAPALASVHVTAALDVSGGTARTRDEDWRGGHLEERADGPGESPCLSRGQAGWRPAGAVALPGMVPGMVVMTRGL
jgi:hypothetical protein